ncbi:disulfide bond formation protein B [Candidatus Kaiserbacteria bacterium]|nr:disulfide bond formation protein B [Candidatus Kaiserbacteria bacterium]
MIALETVNHLVGAATVAMQLAAITVLGAYLMRGTSDRAGAIAASVGRWGIWAGFLLTLGAAAMSLFYSDVLGIEPCPLCWWQRVCMFPQVVLFAMALWKPDPRVADHSIALSGIGLAIALYHHALQVLPSGSLPCPAVGVSCAQRIIFEFGYVTFPLVAATLFSLLIVLMLFVRKQR